MAARAPLLALSRDAAAELLDLLAALASSLTSSPPSSVCRGDGDEARLSFDRLFLEGVTIQSIYPEPDSVETSGDRVTYVFALAEAGSAATVTFRLMHEEKGRERFEVRLDGSESVPISQFIHP